jgi:hypothetical protein
MGKNGASGGQLKCRSSDDPACVSRLSADGHFGWHSLPLRLCSAFT